MKKLFVTCGGLVMTGVAKALTLVEFVILMAVVVAIGVGTAVLLKRAADIPPIDRERQIREGMLPGQGDLWPYFSSNGMPPELYYVRGVDTLPMTLYDPHPIVNPNDPNGKCLEYFEMIIIDPAPIVIVQVCSRIGGEWEPLATVGEGIYSSGFTNEDCRVSIINGTWDIKPSPAAIQKYECMFWRAIPK